MILAAEDTGQDPQWDLGITGGASQHRGSTAAVWQHPRATLGTRLPIPYVKNPPNWYDFTFLLQVMPIFSSSITPEFPRKPC